MQMIARALGGKVALAEKGWGVGVAISKGLPADALDEGA
jgi:GMP synthase-like glutamine amidotransferase